ncbi:uncharacterized protein LOC100211734 [Hydra vulgaris]|uniref:Uncharacterized protein LOC100211734 n=1 Tax=Hydra vulgaris TaxID=6087 RepID=A0ABM4CN84_HYDVU
MSAYQKLLSHPEMDSVSDITLATNVEFSGGPLPQNLKSEVNSKWKNFNSTRRVEKTNIHRKGPAPIEDADALKKSVSKATYGTLDSDVEDLEFEDNRNSQLVEDPYRKVKSKTNDKGDSLASCRALVVYFSKLAKSKDDNETIDLNFVDSLLQNGADINFSDKHGQTILHEIARGWHPDVAKFAIQHGADVNKADKTGRTVLHLAAAVDYDDMVEFLVCNGANLGAKTYGELQTPMHYAAKNNAAASLKTMLRLGAFINDRDYKRRTPLFVAAETARADAARFLIEQGAPAGVYDSSGTPCLSLMIEKMPQIAMEAIEQFHFLDRAFRKHYYYLSYLERDPQYLSEPIPKSKREQKELKEKLKDEKRILKDQGKKMPKKEKTYAKTPLEVIVQYNQLDLVMHVVFQRLLLVKWQLFAKRGSTYTLLINLYFTLIWTFLGIFIPRDRNYYSPLSKNWWRLVLEINGVMLTGYFIFMELSQLRKIENAHNMWRQWRTKHVEKDLRYCHPRWPEERKYLESELAQIRTFQRTYFREPWNIFEWIAYFVVLTLVLTRIMAVALNDQTASEVHPRVYSLGLIVIWLRFMRSCRAYRSLGPFIAILGSVIADTMKFAFLFFEFFIPYVVGFWILFGGKINAKTMGDGSAVNWEHFNDLMFSVWSMTLMGDFDWNGLVAVDRLMAQILCGTYFALAGVVCMNLYIALLSDTFARVYAQAQANAVMQQAQTVILLENKLDRKRKLEFGHFMQKECSPEEVYSRDEGNMPDDHDNDLFEKVTRQITNRINVLEDSIKQGGDKNSSTTGVSRGSHPRGDNGDSGLDGIMHIMNFQNSQISDLKKDLEELKRVLIHNKTKMAFKDQPAPLEQSLYKAPNLTSQKTIEPAKIFTPSQQGVLGYPSSSGVSYYPPPLYSNAFGEQQKPLKEPTHQIFSGALSNQQNPGYITDPEHMGGMGRGKRRRRGKRGGNGNGYDSDQNSVFSEQIPLENFRRPPSPKSVASLPTGKRKKGKKLTKPLTGSWEDIRTDLHV